MNVFAGFDSCRNPILSNHSIFLLNSALTQKRALFPRFASFPRFAFTLDFASAVLCPDPFQHPPTRGGRDGGGAETESGTGGEGGGVAGNGGGEGRGAPMLMQIYAHHRILFHRSARDAHGGPGTARPETPPGQLSPSRTAA